MTAIETPAIGDWSNLALAAEAYNTDLPLPAPFWSCAFSQDEEARIKAANADNLSELFIMFLSF